MPRRNGQGDRQWFFTEDVQPFGHSSEQIFKMRFGRQASHDRVDTGPAGTRCQEFGCRSPIPATTEQPLCRRNSPIKGSVPVRRRLGPITAKREFICRSSLRRGIAAGAW
jgi:hypothetical protein